MSLSISSPSHGQNYSEEDSEYIGEIGSCNLELERASTNQSLAKFETLI